MDYSHIRTIKNPEDKQKSDADSKSFVRKASFAVETEASFEEISSSDLRGISTLAGNLQGGTFAQRARAAELQAARARSELKSKNPQASPSPPPRRLLTLKMPRRNKWTPLDLTATDPDASSILPEVNSSANASEQLSDDGNIGLQANDAPIKESGLDYEIGQLSIDHNSNNRSETLAARLYGSQPTSTLQDKDLSEYPAELGARIESSMPPRKFDDSFKQQQHPHVARGSSTHHRSHAMSSQNPFLRNEQNMEQRPFGNNAPYQQSLQPSPFFDPMNLESVEQELLDSFARAQGKKHENRLYDTNPYHQESIPTISDPRELLKDGVAWTAYRKSLAAVRGTPTANNANAARLASAFPPLTKASNPEIYENSHNPFEPRRHIPRKASEVERELLRRHLESITVEKHTTQPHQSRGGHISGQSNQPSNSTPTPPLAHGSQPLYSQHSQMPSSSRQYDPFSNFNPFTPQNGNQFGSRNSHASPQDIPYNDQNQSQSRRTGIWAPDKDYDGPRSLGNKSGSSEEKRRAADKQEVANWWVRDNRVPFREKRQLEELVAAEARANKHNASGRGSSGRSTSTKEEEGKPTAGPYSNDDLVKDLLIPAIATLVSYKNDRSEANPFSPPPSWAIDHTPGGNQSFFSQQWGTPPQRVGRDPRYRAMQHDGRSSVFEDPTGRFPREEFSHGRGRWGPH